MKIKVCLELTLSRYRLDNKRECLIDLPEGAKVRDVLEYFRIPDGEPLIIVKNGRGANCGDVLNPADVLIILPLMEGG